MNPWWKRPSPGNDGARKNRKNEPGAAKNKKQKNDSDDSDQPSRLGDTLHNADDISELDGDLFEDEAPKKNKKRKRRRKKSGGKNERPASGIGLVLCDLEAFAHTLNTEATNPEPLLEGLWGKQTPPRLRAYTGGRGHARLADVSEELGFELIELEEDQIATQMTVDAWSAADDLDEGEAVLLIADHPSLVPLCEHLKETGVTVLVHRSSDNPLAEACDLDQARPGGEKPKKDKRRSAAKGSAGDQEDDEQDERGRDAQSRRRRGRRDEDSDDRRDADTPDDAEHAEDADESEDSERSEGSHAGGRGKSSKPKKKGRKEKPSADHDGDEGDSREDGKRHAKQAGRSGGKRSARRSQRDPLHVLDAALRELAEGEARVMWATLVRQECHRQDPAFDETHHGYESFQDLLEEAQRRGLLELRLHEKTDSYLVTAWTPAA